MKKPKSKTKQLAAAKRGLKRSLRLKKSRIKVAEKRKAIADRKKAQDRKIANLIDTYMRAKAEKDAK